MDFLKIYIIDIILGLIFALCVGYYYRKGFARSVLEFFSFFGSAVVTRFFYSDLSEWLLEETNIFSSETHPEQKARLVAMIVLFIASAIVIRLLINIIDRFFKLPLIKTANKAMGLVIGALSGFLIVTVICVVLNFVAMTGYEPIVAAIEKSKIMEIDSQIIDAIFPEIQKLI